MKNAQIQHTAIALPNGKDAAIVTHQPARVKTDPEILQAIRAIPATASEEEYKATLDALQVYPQYNQPEIVSIKILRSDNEKSLMITGDEYSFIVDGIGNLPRTYFNRDDIIAAHEEAVFED